MSERPDGRESERGPSGPAEGQERGARPDPVRITFLGGLGEIGRNCACIEVAGRILLLDVGLMFPELDMLGVDLVLPDFTYLRENAERVDGAIITHGHEDHMGGLGYLIVNIGIQRRFPTATLTGVIIVVLLSTIWTFNDFAIIYILTKGGPGGATQVLPVFTYEMAFGAQRLGEAIAVALYMLPGLAAVIIVLARYMRRGQAR